MKRQSMPTRPLRLIAFLALLAVPCPLLAADDSKTAADPLAGAFFPPELVLLARDRIALTPEQLEAFRARVEKTQMRSRRTTDEVGTRNRCALGARETGSRG